MQIEIQLTNAPIAENISPPDVADARGAWLEFRGVVRGEEDGVKISALEYEVYPEMAEREIRRILESLLAQHPCLAVRIIHRFGVIPVGETAIYAGVSSSHRGEALALLAEFMIQLKEDVPIWKARAVPIKQVEQGSAPKKSSSVAVHDMPKPLSLEEALEAIRTRAEPLTPVPVPLAESVGHVLWETVRASEDFPACDRSTRDGYAVLQSDKSERFQVVDTLHAADWKPRQLKPGEAVRVATGAPMPSEKLQVIMQEDVERKDNSVKILFRDGITNIRKRGEELRAGDVVLPAGTCLNAGAMALLAMVGCVQPLVSPRLRIVHFTTGDEIVPPHTTPNPGQIRDSNSVLISSLLQKFPCDVVHSHLREDFEVAKSQVAGFKSQIENANLLLVSGGASVGEKDFTRELMADLGFEIIFGRLNIRPGAPMIFGVNDLRIAFGLPGNPVSHFVCFHLFVAAALRKLTGAETQTFSKGALAAKLDDDPCPRETFLPARRDGEGLHALNWKSSGDITCLKDANALIRIPANSGRIEVGTKVDFLPT